MKIVFLGGGNMANAMIGGLLKQGFPAGDIAVLERDAEARCRLKDMHGVHCGAAIPEIDWQVDVIVLAVKPQQMKEAVEPLIARLDRQIILSIAAGLRLDALSRWLGGYRRIVRSMPNTPALIGAGMSGMYAPAWVSAEERQLAERVLKAAGETLWVAEESQMDAVTAVSGSGPAYAFLLAESMQEAAIRLGFDETQARLLTLHTLCGAAQLALQSSESAAQLRARVTSKGGTTEAALHVMLERGLKEAVMAGVAAANARGKELGQMLGEA